MFLFKFNKKLTIKAPGSSKNEELYTFFIGTPDAIRTHGLQSRSLTLYPTELQAHR